MYTCTSFQLTNQSYQNSMIGERDRVAVSESVSDMISLLTLAVFIIDFCRLFSKFVLAFKLKLDTLFNIDLKNVEISTFKSLTSHIFLLKN